MRRFLAVFALAAGLVALPGVQPARADYAAAELRFSFTDERILESSGAAASRSNPGVLFTHNDSGDTARFFAVGADGATVGTYRLTGASALDWEDMAAGPGPNGGTSLFFADIGDNARTRRILRVFETPEPVVTGEASTVEVALTATHEMVYSDGPHDAEAFLVTPDRRLVVVTKEDHGLSGIYVATRLADGVPMVLRRIATVALPLLQQVGASYAVTGGDLSADGKRLALTTYDRAFEWSVPNGDLAEAVATAPTAIALPRVAQREAIAYGADGQSLIVTTEGLHAPVHTVARTS